jgi:hypothetical protein
MSAQQMARASLEVSASASSKGDSEDRAPAKISTEKDSPDAYTVDWDGPQDPENPLRWSKARKNLHIALVSVFSLTV